MAKTKLLIVDDEAQQRELLAGYLSQQRFEVISVGSGPEALELYSRFFAPVAIIDMKMPQMNGLELLARLRELNPFIQVIVLTAFGSVETAVAAMRAGAFDYLTKPIEDLHELLVKLEKGVEQNRLIVEHDILRKRLSEALPETDLIGESPALQKVKEMIAAVAKNDVTVLITGASGTGKELVARAIHSLSSRAQERLVAINCAAFPETLLEAELFGYEKGAFTGADKPKQGRFELAQGGTLFLDEIGELPLSVQVKLLRVLEERVIQRLGAVRDIPLDIRLITATNRSLEQLVAEKRFREDLFYRLNVMQIHLPTLAERQGDILLLTDHFLRKHARTIGKNITSIDPQAAGILRNYPWPGNIRELEHVIERALILARGEHLTVADLAGLNSPAPASETPSGPVRALADIEKEAILHCLGETGWNIGRSAELLGIHRNTLRLKIKEYQLERS